MDAVPKAKCVGWNTGRNVVMRKKLQNTLLATAAAITVLAAADSSMAGVCAPGLLCLNPNAPNTGAPTATILDGTTLGTGVALDTTANANYPFGTAQSNAQFVSDL